MPPNNTIFRGTFCATTTSIALLATKFRFCHSIRWSLIALFFCLLLNLSQCSDTECKQDGIPGVPFSKESTTTTTQGPISGKYQPHKPPPVVPPQQRLLKREQRSAQAWHYIQLKNRGGIPPNTFENHRLSHQAHQLLKVKDEDVMIFETGKAQSFSNEQMADMAPVPDETIQSYIRKNCTKCLEIEEGKHHRLHQVKRDILHKLGLEKPPNVSHTSIPQKPLTPFFKSLEEEYGIQSDQPLYDFGREDDDDSAKTGEVFAFAQTPPKKWGIPNDAGVAFFNFSDQSRLLDVVNASLRVYIRAPSTAPQRAKQTTTLDVKLYLVTNIDDPKNIEKTDLRLNPLQISSTEGQWISLDAKKIVDHWFSSPDLNFGIVLSLQLNGEELAILPDDAENNEGDYNMFLRIETSDSVRSRAKRSLPLVDCKEGDRGHCCRRPLIIDFKSFGWEFVLAPKRYMAHYCTGTCPVNYLQRYTHTHFTSLAGFGPCCSPAKMEDILLIYFTNDKELKISTIPGMVVSRCGCT
jgi:hypothetical protein